MLTEDLELVTYLLWFWQRGLSFHSKQLLTLLKSKQTQLVSQTTVHRHGESEENKW